jgi:hypothetical protein
MYGTAEYISQVLCSKLRIKYNPAFDSPQFTASFQVMLIRDSSNRGKREIQTSLIVGTLIGMPIGP